MSRVVALLTCLALAGCNVARTQETQAVALGAEVTLAPGATVSVKATSMKVRFVAVTEDSRCPRDVNCIWAGEVKVQLAVDNSTLEVLAGGSAVAAGYRVTVVRVEPQPVSTARIAPQDYRATLKMEKEG
jgi:hypothetical protein